MSIEEIADRNRDEMIRELAALKAERNELREALAELMDNRGSMAALERAQDILARTKEKD